MIEPATFAVLLFVILIILILIGVPIFIALGFSALIGMLMIGKNPVLLVQQMYAAFDVYSYLAIFLFISMGVLMRESKIASDLVYFVDKLIGRRIPGALGITTIIASAFFGALTGATSGTVAAIGSIMIPEMKKRGYPATHAASLTATAGILGQLVPPSISAVIFGLVMNTSISTLFAALLGVAIITTTLLVVVTIIYHVRLQKRNPTAMLIKRPPEKIEYRANILNAFFAGIIIFIVLGGIYSGVFTPTEAGGIGASFAVLLGLFVTKEFRKPKKLLKALLESMKMTSAIMLLISTSYAFSYIITYTRAPALLANSILNFTHNKYVILLIVSLFLIFLGCFIEGNTIIVLTAPILWRLLEPFGIHIIQLGVLSVMAVLVGVLTPPLAVNLYIASELAGVSIDQLGRDLVPYLLVAIFVLIIVALIPEASLYLPKLLGLI